MSAPILAVRAAAAALLLAILLPAGTATGCDLAQIKGDTKVVAALSRRAVDVVRLAAGEDWRGNGRLKALVAPEALFSLGAGDVGRPLGVGLPGAHAMAAELKAGEFSYFGWDYMDGQGDGCAARKVEVEFTDSDGHQKARVEFSFRDGRVAGASGWRRSYTGGRMGGG